MSNNSDNLLPWVLKVISFKPNLIEDYDLLCKETASLVRKELGLCDAHIKRDVKNAIRLGEKLGILTVFSESESGSEDDGGEDSLLAVLKSLTLELKKKIKRRRQIKNKKYKRASEQQSSDWSTENSSDDEEPRKMSKGRRTLTKRQDQKLKSIGSRSRTIQRRRRHRLPMRRTFASWPSRWSNIARQHRLKRKVRRRANGSSGKRKRLGNRNDRRRK